MSRDGLRFLIVLGTWVFCFLMIRVVPRRKGACLFFCGNHRNDYGNHGKRDQYQYQEQQQQQYANSRDPYGKNKKDEPKREKKVDAK